MNKKKVIDYIFDDLENEGIIKFYDDEDYKNYSKESQNKSEELVFYINKYVHPKKARLTLINLIENYIDSCRDLSYVAHKLYYYQGIVDGMDLILK